MVHRRGSNLGVQRSRKTQYNHYTAWHQGGEIAQLSLIHITKSVI